MAREKKQVHKVVMTEGKRNIIQQLLQEYDIESAEDIQEALKDLLGDTIKEMMEAEMDEHLGYEKSARSDSDAHRDDVIVIFAGYQDKMERFLEKNEGLRSRIAFHLNFPDYSSEEMTDIIRLMISEKGFSCSDGVLEKCHDIFEVACKQKEFGNGRYARNLLEQALMAQAKRVLCENKGKK